ncbi:class I adenylate-forming enzyme family protein [Streptomyces sp. WM6386]|uniref:class I adenylate-forming enzyme family protein n=1 Tax=Streptomyces sp. WM6386 TaxID=1415558 RepID=UPI00061977F1|nr:class I adenylate-forming enzyme family protein [Streptomyces sp. WM6386]KKD06663.1 AMP-dependent synthetase [Streptomyces sp. WM6386]
MNLSLLLEMAASGFGDRVVLGSPQGGVTAAELHTRALSGAALIRRSGARSVVYLAGNGAAFAVALFSGAAAGVPVVPLNYRLGSERLRELVAAHEPALVIADDASAARLGDLPVRLTPQEWLDSTAGEAPEPAPATEADPIALLLYTSGTTAAPKAAVLRHSHLTSYVLSTVDFAGAGQTEAALVSVPPYHVAGVSNTVSNLYAGRRVVHLPSFDPGSWLAAARDEGITHALVVPTMLARITEYLGDDPADVPTLTSLAYGGAPMPAPVIERALRLFPDTGFVNAYGLTETSSTIALLGPEDHREPARLGSAGRIVPGVEAQVRDENGAPLPPGEPGALWVRGDQVSGEYLGVSGAREPGGWFHTRDRAYVDTDGYLFVLGRADDTIIRGGENIAPAEIEEVLRTHPAVADAAVTGLPDEEWGERIAAAVVPTAEIAPPTSDELREHVRAVLRSSKTPDIVVLVPGLPYSDLGKLARRQVADTVRAALRTSHA